MTATNNAVFWSSLGFGAGFVFNILLNRKLLPNFWYKNKELMEVIFTNEPIANLRLKKFDDYYPPNLRRIIQLLNSAERSIDLAIYMFYVEALGKAMIDAHNRGVAIRLLGCKTQATSSGNQFPKISNAGISIVFKAKAEMIMHHKFALIDARELSDDEICERDKFLLEKKVKASQQKRKKFVDTATPALDRVSLPKNGICITGSCNWTMEGFTRNRENIIVTSNQIVIDAFQQEFNDMYNDFLESNKMIESDEEK